MINEKHIWFILGLGLILIEKSYCEVVSIDSDGDGHISAEEVGSSSFFKSVDTNGDGTLKKSEILELLRRYGIDRNHLELFSNSRMADNNDIPGLQSDEIAIQWEQLSSLVSVEDVVDWISYAVCLPQYAKNIKENGIKGIDLPLFLQGTQMYVDIGITKKLHQEQIRGALALKFFSLMPKVENTHLDCASASRDKNGGIAYVLKWSFENTKQVFGAPHLVRIMWRVEDSQQWTLLGSFEASLHQIQNVIESTPGLQRCQQIQFRMEAWNIIGRSDYEYTKCNVEDAVQVGNSLSQLFSEIDDNDDGDISSHELRSHIDALFTSAEGDASSESQLTQLSARAAILGMKSLDGNADNHIIRNEINAYWNTIAPLMTVEDTVSWFCFSLELCKYKEMIEKHRISGIHLSSLIANNGEKLQRVGVSDKLDQNRIIRGVTLLLLGAGEAPSRIEAAMALAGPECRSTMIEWTASRNNVKALPEKYRIMRKGADQVWTEIYVGHSNKFVDRNLKVGESYSYRIQTWNLIGPSPVKEILDVFPNSEDCKTILFKLFDWMVYGPLRVLSVVMKYMYEVAGVLSMLSFLMFAWKTLVSQRQVVLRGLRDGMQPVVESKYGSKLGLKKIKSFIDTWEGPSQANSEDERPSVPTSPHFDRLNRAIIAIGSVPSVTRKNAKTSKLDSPSLGPSQSGHPRFRDVVRNVILRKRVVDSFQNRGDSMTNPGSETESVASIASARSMQSEGNGHVKKSSSYSLFRAGSKKKNVVNQSENAPSGTVVTRSVTHCVICNIGTKSRQKHICGVCHQVVCKDHTGYVAHSRWLGCGINSKCRCVDCVDTMATGT